MERLVELIKEHLSEGKSMRELADKCGINHVSLAQYYRGKNPDPKNLAVLSRFFRVDLTKFEDEETAPVHGQYSKQQYPPAAMLLAEEVKDWDSTQILELILDLRKKGAGHVVPQTPD